MKVLNSDAVIFNETKSRRENSSEYFGQKKRLATYVRVFKEEEVVMKKISLSDQFSVIVGDAVESGYTVTATTVF